MRTLLLYCLFSVFAGSTLLALDSSTNKSEVKYEVFKLSDLTNEHLIHFFEDKQPHCS